MVTNGNMFNAPHFQKTFGLSVMQLKALHDAKKFVEGTYVKI